MAVWHFCQADHACGAKVPEGQSFCDAHQAACQHTWRYSAVFQQSQCLGCGVWSGKEGRRSGLLTAVQPVLTREELGYLLGCLEIHVGDLRARTPEQRRAITPDQQPHAEALVEKLRVICSRQQEAIYVR